MADVTVVETEPGTFRVTVEDGSIRTTHTVTVPAGLPASLGCDWAPVTELVRCSFAFLLDREPAGSILARFRLDEIGRYFPEYGAAIGPALEAQVGALGPGGAETGMLGHGHAHHAGRPSRLHPGG